MALSVHRDVREARTRSRWANGEKIIEESFPFGAPKRIYEKLPVSDLVDAYQKHVGRHFEIGWVTTQMAATPSPNTLGHTPIDAR